MTERRWFRVPVVAIVVLSLVILSGGAPALGQWDQGFDRARAVQERHGHQLMTQEGVVGTAVGCDERGGQALLVLVERAHVRDLPASLEGVPVRPIVTGKIYAKAAPPRFTVRPAPGGRTGYEPVVTPVPAAPSNLAAEALGSSQIKLTWTDNSTNETGFKIERKTGKSGFRQIATVGANRTSYSDAGLAGATTYTYRLCAYNGGGNSAYSEEATATTMPARWCLRPVPIGVSTGNANEDAAGTIACRLKDEHGNLYVLSNNHVYARENDAVTGDSGEKVVQPGLFDTGGRYDSAYDIGTLYQFTRIDFSTSTTIPTNTVDAAIATILLDNGVPRVGVATPAYGYGTPNHIIRSLTKNDVGLSVLKYGRTTGLTAGTVTGVNATIDVVYSQGTARFVNQIVVQSWHAFIKAGDSGSLVVTNDRNRNPVGLVFAGNDAGTYAVANHIEDVLNAFADMGVVVQVDDGK